MKYSILIIDSENAGDFWNGSADGIRYNNLEKEKMDTLIELSLKQNFSVIVQKHENEE